ncbi:MAG: thioredoxin family protein [Pyrinomonadaceae bacterium]|nr:thioredoxin family protein [Pyrinomonadaceae bacterium]
MKKLALTFVLALIVCAAVATAQQSQMNAGSTNNTVRTTPDINSTIADFTLPDASGKQHSLRSLRGAKGTALIFVSTQCPVSNAYNERMEKLAQDYRAKGINVIGINSNKAETPDVIKAHAQERNLTFPILKDAGNKIADRFGAEFTPEVYLLDANNRIVYHGRIDNARNPQMIESNDLRDAADAVLAGRPVARAQTKAFGCTIKRS